MRFGCGSNFTCTTPPFGYPSREGNKYAIAHGLIVHFQNDQWMDYVETIEN
jgi:hypothetical protein